MTSSSDYRSTVGGLRGYGRRLATLGIFILLGASGLATGCGSDSTRDEDDETRDAADTHSAPPDRGDPPREREEDFEFSRPAVVGENLYVANTTLNSVAVIDTATLSIATIPVGFRPTRVAGPDRAHADSMDARVMVLNAGNDSVSVIDPESNDTTRHEVMRGANALEVDPRGRYGIAWYDPSEASSSSQTGDLASVTVVTPGETYEIAVGFRVREVFFDESGTRALVWSNDGVSRIDLEQLSGDGVAEPTRVIPDSVGSFEADGLEIRVDPSGRYVATRSRRLRGLVLLDLNDRTYEIVPTFEIPTDLDFVPTGDGLEALAMLRSSSRALRIDIPAGFDNAAAALSDRTDRLVVPPNDSTKSADAGVLDAAAADASNSDAGANDSGTADSSLSTPDVGAADTGPSDATGGDTTAGADAAADTGTADTGPTDSGTRDADSDAGPDDSFPAISGLRVAPVRVPNLGAASVGADADTALLFTTRGDEKRVVLWNLGDGSQRALQLEKKVRGATSDRRGRTFVVFNQKQPGEIPPDATPVDPEYIRRSWGITLLDVETTKTQTILLKHEPGLRTLWSPDSGASKLYSAFQPPSPDDEPVRTSRRDVLEANLETFSTRTYRMPSVPVALGTIPAARNVFVSQRHPQGRMTFIDAVRGERQTVTGYQLNAEID